MVGSAHGAAVDLHGAPGDPAHTVPVRSPQLAGQKVQPHLRADARGDRVDRHQAAGALLAPILRLATPQRSRRRTPLYVLVLAAPAWPVSPPPTCPTCGGALRYQGFLATHQERCMTTDTS